MALVLITGSSDGLGLMAGELLARDGHEVTLHARNDTRAGMPAPRCPPRRTWSSVTWPASRACGRWPGRPMSWAGTTR